MSIYNQLPERGFEVRIWPSRIPEDAERYKGMLAPYIVSMVDKGVKHGTVTDPERFTDVDLMERAASYGRSGFALQFMLDTSLSDAEKYPLKLEDLIVLPLDHTMAPVKIAWSSGTEYALHDVPSTGMGNDRFYRPMWTSPEMTEYAGTVMFIDPSGRGKDETAYAIVKMLNGILYLVDIGGIQGGYTKENLETLAKAAKRFGVNDCVIESNFGDGMYLELLKPVMASIHPCAMDEVRVNSQKERRIIDTLEPVMNQHRLVIDKRLIKKDADTASNPYYSLFYQMTRITKAPGALSHDDRLDALAGAVAYWVDQIGRDTEKALEEHQEKLREIELRKFMEQSIGGSTKGSSSWVSW